MNDFDKKFINFLESLKNEDSKILIYTILEGFDYIFNRVERNNPFALIREIQAEKPVYDIAPLTKRPKFTIDEKIKPVLREICKKFNITEDNIRDEYLTKYQHLTFNQFVNKLKNYNSWKTNSFYDNDKDTYYGLCNEKFSTPIDSTYRDNVITSGGN